MSYGNTCAAASFSVMCSLQTALPGAGGELKELLTDLIIMESRPAGRSERLQGLVAELKDALPAGVPVDEQRLREAVVEMLEAAARVETAAERSP